MCVVVSVVVCGVGVFSLVGLVVDCGVPMRRLFLDCGEGWGEKGGGSLVGVVMSHYAHHYLIQQHYSSDIITIPPY